ncbi:hypothetical protein [Klebsiella pneumoniae]|uniref:hypothetical protein n=1 Tax=Klebsiella pneumoniae TaxID=573 RepID=UPI0028680CF0|nr:hypothetical protein [Klebsiella pneumoniae]WMW82791.1 hypothetical protein RG050_00475 [Klebsiella pneumoniae]
MNKKTEKINNEIKEQAAFSFNVVGGTGKVTNFTPGNNGTVQPVALLRLGVFVPGPSGRSKEKPPRGFGYDGCVTRFTAYADRIQ